MTLIFVHTYTQMHIKNVYWLTSLDVYFSLNVSTNMSNLPLDPSPPLPPIALVFKFTEYTNLPVLATTL